MKIVTSNNPFVYDELGAEEFRSLNAETIVAASGDELLAEVRLQVPDLVVIDAELPELDGYSVCEAIKSDASLAATRVILVVQGAISSAQLQRLARCGCDDVIVFRVPGESLYQHAVRLLGLPDPSLLQPVALQVTIADDASREITARATRLSPTGVDLTVDAPLAPGAELRLRLRRAGTPHELELGATIERCTDDPISKRHTAHVRFSAPSSRDHAQLADFALWDATRLDDGLRVHLRGSFDEQTDFSRVPTEGLGTLVFDLSRVELINSWGARQWIMFMRSLPKHLTVRIVNAASVFVKHCNMIADMRGPATVESFAAPYRCRSCNREHDRMLQSSSISPAIAHEPPECRCPRCGGVEAFDDLPGRYFAFLGVV